MVKRKILSLVLAIGCLVGVLAGCSDQQSNGPVDIQRAALSDVRLEEGIWKDKCDANASYIESLDPDRVLYFYYQTGGMPVPEGVQPYGGCESNIDPDWHGGMLMGHVLSANSMLFASTGQEKYRQTVRHYLEELEKCQQPNGYLYSKSEELFDNLESGQGRHGVLYYYIHKIFAGLIDAYELCGEKKALDIVEKCSDWLYARMSKLSKNQLNQVLVTEYGGMNEALYNLYAITGKERDKKNAEFFNESTYFDTWAQNQDNLYMKHGNTAIPKAVGYARGYQVTGEQKLLDAAANFWKMIVDGRIFATGGTSERELLGQFGTTSSLIYDNPSETCKSYNMLKLSQYLYEITGESKYVDYIERVLLNSLMGSIDEDGCKTYYQRLGTDSKKLFHDRFNTFWCCTGTGLETFSKVGEACWHTENESTLQLNVFISSTYDNGNFGVTLASDDEKNELTIKRAPQGKFALKLRAPYWAKSLSVKINGQEEKVSAKDGYITLNRRWKAGDKITYITEYDCYTESTFDQKDIFVFKYGPYVLCANGKRYEARNRVAGNFNSGWLSELNAHLTVQEEGYLLKTPDFDIPMKKYGEIVDEYYTMHFQRIDAFAAGDLDYDLAMHAIPSSSTGYAEFPSTTQTEREFYSWQTGLANYLFAMQDGMIGEDKMGLAPDDMRMQSAFAWYLPSVRFPSGNHWVAYDFNEEYEVSRVQIAFYESDDSATARVSVPSSVTVQYLDGSNWADVQNQSGLPEGDGYRTVTFQKVKTKGLRLVIRTSSPFAIREWKVG